MNEMLSLKRIHSLVAYSMVRVISPVMAQAWFLSTKCRHTVRGRGLLRMPEGTLA